MSQYTVTIIGMTIQSFVSFVLILCIHLRRQERIHSHLLMSSHLSLPSHPQWSASITSDYDMAWQRNFWTSRNCMFCGNFEICKQTNEKSHSFNTCTLIAWNHSPQNSSFVAWNCSRHSLLTLSAQKHKYECVVKWKWRRGLPPFMKELGQETLDSIFYIRRLGKRSGKG